VLAIHEPALCGEGLIKLLASIVPEFKPDLIKLDPLQSFAGADLKDDEKMIQFLQHQLTPLLRSNQCGAIIPHHTPKSTNRDTTSWRESDWQYSGAGSAVLANWVRAMLVIEPTKAPGVFKFIGAKRGRRVGWRDEEGERVIIKHFAHSGTDELYWREARPEDFAQSDKSQGDESEDMLKRIVGHVPEDMAVHRDDVKFSGIAGEKKVDAFIKKAVREGVLFEWFLDRQKFLSRCEEPKSKSKKEILVGRWKESK
ncbi:MAG: hypothetical protein AAF514_12420, partial [Verrucomicrobiota bacterium]